VSTVNLLSQIFLDYQTIESAETSVNLCQHTWRHYFITKPTPCETVVCISLNQLCGVLHNHVS